MHKTKVFYHVYGEGVLIRAREARIANLRTSSVWHIPGQNCESEIHSSTDVVIGTQILKLSVSAWVPDRIHLARNLVSALS